MRQGRAVGVQQQGTALGGQSLRRAACPSDIRHPARSGTWMVRLPVERSEPRRGPYVRHGPTRTDSTAEVIRPICTCAAPDAAAPRPRRDPVAAFVPVQAVRIGCDVPNFMGRQDLDGGRERVRGAVHAHRVVVDLRSKRTQHPLASGDVECVALIAKLQLSKRPQPTTDGAFVDRGAGPIPRARAPTRQRRRALPGRPRSKPHAVARIPVGADRRTARRRSGASPSHCCIGSSQSLISNTKSANSRRPVCANSDAQACVCHGTKAGLRFCKCRARQRSNAAAHRSSEGAITSPRRAASAQNSNASPE